MRAFHRIGTAWVAVALLFGLGACDQKPTTGSASVGQKGLVAIDLPDATNPFLSMIGNELKTRWTAAGYDFQIADAQGDVTKQANQIETFGSMKAKLVYVLALEPKSIAGAIQNAQKNGTKVLVMGSDTGVQDVMVNVDQGMVGKAVAAMAAEWVAKTFPHAKPGSVKTVVFENRDTPEAVKRSEGIATVSSLSPAIQVVRTIGGAGTNLQSTQPLIENFFQTTNDIQLVLGYNTVVALSVSALVEKPDGPIKDKAKFGVFCSDYDPEILTSIKKSADNTTVTRGTVKFGSDDIWGDVYRLGVKLVAGDEVPKVVWDPVTAITLANIDQYSPK